MLMVFFLTRVALVESLSNTLGGFCGGVSNDTSTFGAGVGSAGLASTPQLL